MHKIRSYTPSFLADSGLYFVQDENNFINPLLQVGSGSNEKRCGSGRPKINRSDRIRILIPGIHIICMLTTRQTLRVHLFRRTLLKKITFICKIEIEKE